MIKTATNIVLSALAAYGVNEGVFGPWDVFCFVVFWCFIGYLLREPA